MPELAFWAADGGPLTLSDAARSVTLALFEQAETLHQATAALRFEDHTVAWSLYFADPDGNRFEITTYDYSVVAEALADD